MEKQDKPETVEITLDYPIVAGKGRVEKLIMRRPKVRDLKASSRFGSGAENQEVDMFAILTGLVPEDLDGLDMVDYAKLQDSFRGLLDRSRKPVAPAGDAGEVVQVSAE